MTRGPGHIFKWIRGSIGLLILIGNSSPGSVLKPAQAFVVRAPLQGARRHRQDPTFLEHDGSRTFATPSFSRAPATNARTAPHPRSGTIVAGMSNDDGGVGYSGIANSTDSSCTTYPPSRHEGGTAVDADLEILQGRLARLRAEVSWNVQATGRPPSADLGPVDFVTAVLSALRDPDAPLPDSGFRTLQRSSTRRWRDAIRRNVGAPVDADEDSIARALSNAMARPNNLFGLLVGTEECDVVFPSDVLDFEDGECWLACNLCRCRGNNYKVLVATNWKLKRREGDGAWLVDDIDFRDLRYEDVSDARGYCVE